MTSQRGLSRKLLHFQESRLFRVHLLLHHIGRGTLYVMQGLYKASQTRVFEERVQPSSPPHSVAEAKVWITGLQWTHSSSLAVLIRPELPVGARLQKLPPLFFLPRGFKESNQQRSPVRNIKDTTRKCNNNIMRDLFQMIKIWAP